MANSKWIKGVKSVEVILPINQVERGHAYSFRAEENGKVYYWKNALGRYEKDHVHFTLPWSEAVEK